MAEKTITEHLTELEKAVKDAESKQSVLNVAVESQKKASADYSNAVSKVERLQSEIQERIGNIFTSSSRIKISA